MIRVFVVDDHSIVREGAKRIIESEPDMAVQGESGNGLEALKLILENDYDVVLLDIGLPGMDGLDVLRAVREKKPRQPVLMLSMYPEGQYASRVLREGASGYVPKESLPVELVSAIRKAARGRKYISDSFAENVACGLTAEEKPPHERLSSKEHQVFRMIVAGKTTKEIAAELSLARSTVSTYRARILDKMKAKSTGELFRYAIENKLLP